MEEASIMLPIGGLKLIRNLRHMSNDRLLILVGDKGYAECTEFENVRDPHMAVHGSCSFMVNFHALKYFTEQTGGSYRVNSYRDGLKCAAMLFGINEKCVPRTLWAFNEGTRYFGPASFFSLQRAVKEDCLDPSVKLVLALIRLSEYDSDVFYKFKRFLIEKSVHPYATEHVQFDIQRDARKVVQMHYPLQKTKDVHFELGRLLMALKNYDEARLEFQNSNDTYGHHYVTWHNLGICCYHLGMDEHAQQNFEKSLAMCPGYQDALDWRERLKTKMNKPR
jgi:tetratricopeptide (TPR) repeat protein